MNIREATGDDFEQIWPNFHEVVAGVTRLWQKHGFEIVGTVPKAFMHPAYGYVGAHVMFKWLKPDER